MRRFPLAPLVLASALMFQAVAAFSPAFSEETWKVEFDTICSKTEEAMSLSDEELRALVERCDRLRADIEKLDDSTRKVYLRKLQRCRDLLQFVLETGKDRQLSGR